MTGLTIAEMTPGRPFGREIDVTEARLTDTSDEAGVWCSSEAVEVSLSSDVADVTSSFDEIAVEVMASILLSHSGEAGGVSAKIGVVVVAAVGTSACEMMGAFDAFLTMMGAVIGLST